MLTMKRLEEMSNVLKKLPVDKNRIITTDEAEKLYDGYYVGMVITESNVRENWAKGYVVYISDENDYGHDIPHRTEDGEYITIHYGPNVPTHPEMGGIYLDKCPW